jgi:hypothetical protein
MESSMFLPRNFNVCDEYWWSFDGFNSDSSYRLNFDLGARRTKSITTAIVDGQPADQNTTFDGIFCYKQTTSVFL